jgi:hypothetical protein
MGTVFSGGSDKPLIKLALGKGKKAKRLYALQTLDDIVGQLKQLPREISVKYQLAALRKAAKPGMDALRSQVAQLGEVTGNLAASVAKVDRKYTNNRAKVPIGVVVVGFRRPVNSNSQKGATPAFLGGTVLKGPNRAYHSHLVEYGTKARMAGKSKQTRRKRVVLGGRIRTIISREKQQPVDNPRYILSSFKTRGPFMNPGQRRYPVDFIASGQVRGSPARRPLEKAYAQSKAQMQSILDAEMRRALRLAIRATQKKYGDFGT